VHPTPETLRRLHGPERAPFEPTHTWTLQEAADPRPRRGARRRAVRVGLGGRQRAGGVARRRRRGALARGARGAGEFAVPDARRHAPDHRRRRSHGARLGRARLAGAARAARTLRLRARGGGQRRRDRLGRRGQDGSVLGSDERPRAAPRQGAPRAPAHGGAGARRAARGVLGARQPGDRLGRRARRGPAHALRRQRQRDPRAELQRPVHRDGQPVGARAPRRAAQAAVPRRRPHAGVDREGGRLLGRRDRRGAATLAAWRLGGRGRRAAPGRPAARAGGQRLRAGVGPRRGPARHDAGPRRRGGDGGGLLARRALAADRLEPGRRAGLGLRRGPARGRRRPAPALDHRHGDARRARADLRHRRRRGALGPRRADAAAHARRRARGQRPTHGARRGRGADGRVRRLRGVGRGDRRAAAAGPVPDARSHRRPRTRWRRCRTGACWSASSARGWRCAGPARARRSR
jgi:hypothetical protein